MTKKQILTTLTALIMLAASWSAAAANLIWFGTSGSDLLWKTSANWTPAGPPGTSDFAKFFDAGATNVLGSAGIDSEVSQSITIATLWLSQTNNVHNLLIDPGVTLTVAGTNFDGYGALGSDPTQSAPTNEFSMVYAGSRDPALVGTVVSNTISGGGTLVLNNTNNEMNVRQVFAGGGGAHQAVLNLSGLNNFVAKLGRIRVGDGENAPLSRAQGQLWLALTNTLTLTGPNSADNDQLVIGNNDQNNNGNSSISIVYLGLTNRINADKILVGGQKQQGQMLLNPAFVSPSVVLRGSDGVSRVAALRIGDESDAGASGSPSTGVINLLAGTSDLLVDTLIIGKGQNGSGNTTAATGTFVMGRGMLDVNSLLLASQTNASQGGTITGTATFSNSTVVVNTRLALGTYAGSPAGRVATLNLSGGSMTVNGSYRNQGTVTINVTNATLTMPAGASILAKTIQLDGGTLAGAGTIKVTNTLTIVDNGGITGSPIFDLGNSLSPATWDVQAITNGSLTVSNTLQGAGNFYGNLIQAPGASLSPGGVSIAGSLYISGNGGNLTLNDGGTLNFDLSASGNGVNDQIIAGGTVTVNGTNNVYLKSLGGSLDTTTPYILISAAAITGNQTQFRVVGPLVTGRYTFTFDTSTPGQIRLIVGGTGPASQTWAGDSTSNTWDAQGAFNWNNGAASQFFNLDNVTFNNTGSDTPAVSITGALVAGSMTASNSTRNYAFKGTGSLTVAGPLNKFGTGSLTFSNQNDNSFSSLTTISNGVVTFANNGQNTFYGGLVLAGGSLTLAGNSTNIILDPNNGLPVVMIGTGTTLSVLNTGANVFNGTQLQLDGTLVINQPVDATVDALIIDSGSLIKNGSGKLTLSGNNSGFGGLVQINAGSVIAGGLNSALGQSGVTITNTGVLDINGKNIGLLPVTVSGSGPDGSGALVNNGGPQNTGIASTTTALSTVNLAADATFGGSGHWNTDPIQNAGYFVIAGSLNTGGNLFNLTKTGFNQLSLINASVDPALGNILVQQGLLNFQGATTSMGNPASNIVISAGATVGFYDTSTPWDKKFILFGDGATANLFNYDGQNTIIGAVTLNGNCVIGGAPVGRGAPVSLTLNGPVSGSGALIKPASDSQDTLLFAGTNTYTGTTTVSGGTLLVEGINGTNTITVSGGTLGGIGIIPGAVSVAAGGNLSPGDTTTPLATLTISNQLSLAGTTTLDLSKSGSSLTSDLVTNISTLTLGGTLQLNLAGDSLAAGDSFKLFSFASATGAVVSVSPSAPADGLQWDTSHLAVDGTLRVASVSTTPVSLSTSVTGGQLNLSWPTDHTGWRLQSQTNSLGAGLGATWFDVTGSALVNSVTITPDPANGTVFYRLVYP